MVDIDQYQIIDIYKFNINIHHYQRLIILGKRINQLMQLTLIQFGALSVFCSYLVYYYSGPSVSFHVKMWSTITWVLNFGIALLVPEDLYQSLGHTKDPQFISSPVFKSISTEYLVLYWTVYILTWTIIPVLQQWQNSGDLNSIDRLKRSLKTNAIFYAYMIVGGIIGLVLLILLKAGGDMGLLTYLKCLATSFGMFLLMLLMGYAMAEIPKTLWQGSSPETHLAYLYNKINALEDQLHASEFEFKKVMSFVLLTKQQMKNDGEIQLYCETCLNKVPSHLVNKLPKNYKTFLKEINYIADYPIGLESSIEHHRLLKRILGQMRRLQHSTIDYAHQAVFYEDVKSSKEKNSRKLQTIVIKNTNSYHYYWFCIFRPIFKKVIAILFGIASLIIIISESQIFLTKQSSLLGYLLQVDNLQLIRVLCLLVITYISYMAYYSLFRLKLSNIYGLYKFQSDGPSLMFATINFSRIGVAIVLNFFDMLKMQSIFTISMAAPDMGLLGDWVIKGMPGVLWLIVISHFFNFWGKAMKYLGLQNLSFSSHDYVEGNKLCPYVVREHRKKLEKQRSQNILIS